MHARLGGTRSVGMPACLPAARCISQPQAGICRMHADAGEGGRGANDSGGRMHVMACHDLRVACYAACLPSLLLHATATPTGRGGKAAGSRAPSSRLMQGTVAAAAAADAYLHSPVAITRHGRHGCSRAEVRRGMGGLMRN
jgi:hypothetical protein